MGIQEVQAKIDSALSKCTELKHEFERNSCKAMVQACSQAFIDSADGSGRFEIVNRNKTVLRFSSVDSCFSLSRGAAMMFGSDIRVKEDGVELIAPPSGRVPEPALPGAQPAPLPPAQPQPAPGPEPIPPPPPATGTSTFEGSKLLKRIEVDSGDKAKIFWEVMHGGMRYVIGYTCGSDSVTVNIFKDNGGFLPAAPLFGDDKERTIDYLEGKSNDQLVQFLSPTDPGMEMEAIDNQYKKAKPQLDSGLLSSSLEIPKSIELKAKCKAQDRMRDLLRLPVEMLEPAVCPDAEISLLFKHSKHTYLIGPRIADRHDAVMALTGAFNAFKNDPKALDMAVELGGIMFVYVDRYSASK